MSLIKKRYLGTLLKSESRIGRTRLAAIRWQNVGLAKKRKQTGEKCLLKQGSNFKCDYFNLTPHIRKVPRRRVFTTEVLVAGSGKFGPSHCQRQKYFLNPQLFASGDVGLSRVGVELLCLSGRSLSLSPHIPLTHLPIRAMPPTRHPSHIQPSLRSLLQSGNQLSFLGVNFFF